jgi:hypothetical protein
LSPEQSVDVMFHEFMADDIGTVEAIYARAGLAVDDRTRRRFDEFMRANPRGKHGRVEYDLQRDFGLSPADVHNRFAFYFDRFPVRSEHRPEEDA